SRREPLAIPGEVTRQVPALAIPDPHRSPSPDELARYAAVRLFVERARAARSGFTLTAENAPTVGALCARLDGLPLAIELAAARVRVLAVGQIAERLAEGLGLLSGGGRTAAPRQRTLEATLDWS